MDSNAGSAAFLNCCEIVNSSRVFAYLSNGIRPSSMELFGDCGCTNLRELIECDDTPYDLPSTDPAPWYDPTIPESADFGGFLPIEFSGLSSVATRNVTEVVSGGGVLGRLRFPPRTLTWRGLLIGKTCCSVAYGLRWLTSQLLQTSCESNCKGFELDILICCPDIVLSDTPEIMEGQCGPINNPATNDAWRVLKNTGLVNGPTILSERRTNCGCGCGNITEIEFTLVAGQPQLYKTPILLCDCLPFPSSPVTDCATQSPWLKIIPPATCPEEETCPPEVMCNENPNCPNPVLPIISTVDRCDICDPIDPVTVCCHVEKENFGVFFEGVPYIDIYSGSTAISGVRIDVYEDPMETGCDTVDVCNRCTTLTITYIPAFSHIIIDGTTRRVLIDCPGQGQLLPAENLTVSPFQWPVLSCIDWCFCFTTESSVSSDACVSLSIVPREN